MYCRYCGKGIPNDSTSCAYCGNDLTQIKQSLLESYVQRMSIPGVEIMSPGDIVKEALKSVGWTQATLSKKMGYSKQSSVSNRINEGSMRVDTFVKFLDAMGYEVVVKSIELNSNKNIWKVGDEICNQPLSLMQLVAEQERKNLELRTKHGRAKKAAGGGYSGGKPPYGYRVNNGRLVINEEEKEVVLDIFSKKDSMPMLRIAECLNNSGRKTRSGGQFYASNIKMIFKNEPFYRGMYRYGVGKDNNEVPWVKGEHEPILVD